MGRMGRGLRHATFIANVNSLTVAPSLHRLVPRRALETTAFGYEVIAANHCVDDCIETVRWVDCWCPDAAQFVLIDACDDLRAGNCQQLIQAFRESHLYSKMRLVCGASILGDDELLAILHHHDIGFLLASYEQDDLEALAHKGILGVRIDAETLLASSNADARGVVDTVHDMGLRSIASQVPTSSEVRNLLAIGFDYVSQSEGGFMPADPSFSWRGRVA